MPRAKYTIPATVIGNVADKITVQIGQAGQAKSIPVSIERIKLRRSANGGTPAVNIRPRIFRDAAGANETLSQEYDYEANWPLASGMFDQTDVQAYAVTDADGRLYIQPNPDLAGDTFEGELWVEFP